VPAVVHPVPFDWQTLARLVVAVAIDAPVNVSSAATMTMSLFMFPAPFGFVLVGMAVIRATRRWTVS
jgi:hypothetical protein